jgi:acyl-CoA reductase-like NAD-dependent aldehyde dehydrogenase
MEKPYFSAGRWIAEGTALEVRSPFDHKTVAVTFRPAPDAVAGAVDAAVCAFTGMKAMPTHRRSAILRAVSAGIEERSEEFAATIAREAGKPIRIARTEAARAVRTFAEAAEECSRLYGEILPLDVAPAAEGREGLTKLVPLGPVLAVTPFNFPLNLVAHKIAPAIAAGCPVILKPSSETPLSALLLAEVIEGAGLPAGALSVLPMTGAAAEALAARDEIRKVTFTGSDTVGWRLKRKAWSKRVTLELGGNAAVVLHDDWDDIEGALGRIVLGSFAYSGQVCISVQRIFVHERIFVEFMERFVAAVERLRVGDPLDEATDIGPMITEEEAARVEAWVNEAVADGAELATGGRRDGAFYRPTVLTGARGGMRVVDDEIFGPVVAVFPYAGFDDALAAVNDSRFGLQAGVYTRDIGRIRRAFEELEVGGVIAGDVPTFRVDRMPYGGVKGSGFGREGLRYAIREMCEERLLVLAVR